MSTSSTGTQAVTDDTFDAEVLGAEGPVLVDFWAAWCGPCRMVAPVLEQLAQERAGSLKVAKVDVDRNPSVSARYSITSIPTMMVFKDGVPVRTIVGARPKSDIEAELAGV